MDLGKTYDELTERLTMNELSMWVAFYTERQRLANEDGDNLATKSSSDILKGFGL